MGVFRNFPYSNFHEMNMDEIIKIIKNMLEEWATYHAEWDRWMADLEESWSEYQGDVNAQWTAYQNTMNTAWQSMQNFINNYFDNLDVQEEINNKIVSMLQTGEFGLLLNEYVPPAVTAWLNLNITEPTGVVIDTSLSVSGACADAKATGDAINTVKDEIIDIEKWSGIERNYQLADTPGAIYYSDGTPQTDSTVITDNLKYSDFLPVLEGAEIKYKLLTPLQYCMIAFYTTASAGGYVQESSVEGTGGPVEGTYTVPANGFVIITARNDLTDKYAIYKVTGSYNEQVETRLTTLEDEITPLVGINGSVAFLEQETFSLMGQPTTNGFLRNDGTLAEHAQYRTTGYIPVKNGQTFKYKIGHAITLPVIAFYTEKTETSAITANFVSGINGYVEGTYTVDSDGYIRICYYYDRTEGYVVFDENIPDNVKIYFPPNNGVKNLNILCLGDSIFGNDLEIETYLASLTGANVLNGAFGGTRVTDRGGSDNFQYFDGVNLVEALTTQVWTDQDAGAEALTGYPWVSTYLANLKAVDMSTIDLITMNWGTNDYTGGKTIEEITTAYNSVIDMLQATYPSIRLLIITPIWRYFGAKTDNDNGDNHIYNVSTLKQIATAIDENAKDKRIESLQMYQKMPLSYNTADLYFDSGDSTHLNATGNIVYAHILNGKIQSMY